MTLREVWIKSQKMAVDNSPAILTAIGVTGTVYTAFLTGKASFKAASILEKEQQRRNLNRSAGEPKREMETKEKFDMVWKLYIPAVATGALTCASIISANRIGTRRTAAMAAAYSISEKAYSEYRDKVVEKLGESKERAVRDEIAQDAVNRNPVSQQVVVVGGGESLCMDKFSGRYFMSDMETLKKAQNDANYQLLNEGYLSLSEFYSKIGLSPTSISDNVGWNADKLMELEFSTTMSDDDRPCLVMDFWVAPIRNFFRTH